MAVSSPAASTSSEAELADLDRRITVERLHLHALRADLDAEVARNVLGEPDGEALATVRAAVAHQAEEVNLLMHARELTVYKLENRKEHD